MWPHSPHSPQQSSVCLRLSSAHLPPSPLSSPDCQAATEEEEEDFYHEDSALVIKEETGPEAGAVLSLPEPAYSAPCKSKYENLIFFISFHFNFKSQILLSISKVIVVVKDGFLIKLT